jgi:hypothetical protein
LIAGIALILVGLLVFALGSSLGWILGMAGFFVLALALWERAS